MFVTWKEVTSVFKVGQLLFRPVTDTGVLGNVKVSDSDRDNHALTKFVRTMISDPNQNIYEPTIAMIERGIVTWLLNDDGSPFKQTELPFNWYALRIKRESRNSVFNASVLTCDAEGLEYYLRWRQEVAKFFDDFEAVQGLPFELSPSSTRIWFKPEYDESMRQIAGYETKLIKAVE